MSKQFDSIDENIISDLKYVNRDIIKDNFSGTNGKVNSVQEACTKCFAVHMLKFEILQIIRQNKTKNIKMLKC